MTSQKAEATVSAFLFMARLLRGEPLDLVARETNVSGGEFGVRGYLTAYESKDGKEAWRAYSTGPDPDMLVDPVNTTELGKPPGRCLGFQVEGLPDP